MKVKRLGLLWYGLSFVIPFAIVLLVYIALHIAPFGDRTLFIADARSLYLSNLGFMSRALRGQEDLLYSFKMGIGMNTIMVSADYASPVNLLVLFFDITSYATLYSIIIAIRISTCGFTMFHFLRVSYGRSSKNILFSTIYAFIGFNVANCFLYPFLLYVELLPLIALGIRRIVHNGRPWFYVVTMTYTVFVSFYFGYMLYIASFALFLFWFFEDSVTIDDKKRVWIRYLLSSLCAGLLPAAVWLPSLFSISGGRLNQNSIFDLTFNENMSITDMGAKLFVGANNLDELANGMPNIFCGSLVVFLVILFFVDSSHSARSKIVHAMPLVFYVLTFYIKAFSMALQGFSDTNWFNFRYSFVFSFIMICFAYEEFLLLPTISGKEIKKALAVYAIVILAVFSHVHTMVNGGEMLLSVLILALSLAVVWWNRVDEVRAPEKYAVILVLILCSIELYANFVICLYNIQDWGVKEGELQDSTLVPSAVIEAIAIYDDSLYRMENENSTWSRYSNDPKLFGYNGTRYFGSNQKDFVFKGLSKLGLPWCSNRMWYAGGMPVALDSLLGIKYVISTEELDSTKNYERVIGSDKGVVYVNNLALPFGVFTSSKEPSVHLTNDPFENHNSLWKYLTGCENDVFTVEENVSFIYKSEFDSKQSTLSEAQEYTASLEDSESIVDNQHSDAQDGDHLDVNDRESADDEPFVSPWWVEYSFEAQMDGPIYSYYKSAVSEQSGYFFEAMEYVGTYHKGDVVTGRFELTTEPTNDIFNIACADFYIAYEDEEVLEQYCKQLRGDSGTLEKLTDSHLVGELDAKTDGRLFLSIPYDEGWTLAVDGEEVPLEMDAELFMSASIAQGEHSYELTFFPKGMREGISISIAGIALLGVLVFLSVRWKKADAATRPDEVGDAA